MKTAFVGDVMLGRTVNQVLKSPPSGYPWGDTLDLLARADLRVCNLECVISDRGEPLRSAGKMFHFRTDAKNVACLKSAGINIVSLANNHALDFGCEALEDMFKILDKAGIAHAGAGRDLEQAARRAIVKVDGKSVAFMAFTDNEPAWEAKAGTPGVYFVPVDLEDGRAKELLRRVSEARARADAVIVSAHWGPNWGYEPQPHHIPFARALVEAGADIIFGHSCHVFQGVEIYRGKPIIYSAGDFVDDYAVDEIERNDQSFIFFAEIQDGKVSGMTFYPTVIADYQARRAVGRDAENIAAKMRELCKNFGTEARWNKNKRCLEVSDGGMEVTVPFEYHASSRGNSAADFLRFCACMA